MKCLECSNPKKGDKYRMYCDGCINILEVVERINRWSNRYGSKSKIRQDRFVFDVVK